MSRKKLRDPRLFYRDDSDVIHARVPGANGKIRRLSTHCHSEDAAREFADREERRYASPSYAAAASATLEGAVNARLDDMRRQKRREESLGFVVTKTGHFLRIWGPSLPLIALVERGGAMVLEYIDKRQGEGVGDYTIKREVRELARVLELAKFTGTFPGEIQRVIPPTLTGSYTPRRRSPTPSEVEALCAALAPDRAAHVAWYVATGSREDESLRACREDVVLDELRVHVRGTKTSASDDDVPITPITLPWITRALRHAPAPLDAPPGTPLFRPWGNYLRDLKAACVRAGIESVTPNDLRRAFGRWHREALVRSGRTPKTAAEVVSRLLRHTTDKLSQQTYAVLEAAVAGEPFALLGPVEPTVSNSCSGNVPEGLVSPETEQGSEEKTEETRSGTRVSNSRPSAWEAKSHRISIGSKIGRSRKRAELAVSNSCDPPPRFPLGEATANLYELLYSRSRARGHFDAAVAS